MLKNIIYIGLIIGILSCSSAKKGNFNQLSSGNTEEEKSIRIANDSLEYEIVIMDIGFNRFLNSQTLPRGFHSQQYLESRNNLLVTSYNQRVLQPGKYGTDLYPLTIQYEYDIDYGYEVNYLLFNYFLFFQQKYNQRL